MAIIHPFLRHTFRELPNYPPGQWLNEKTIEPQNMLGIIKIDGIELEDMREYTYKDNTICGCNVNVCLGANDFKASEMGANEIVREKYLYRFY